MWRAHGTTIRATGGSLSGVEAYLEVQTCVCGMGRDGHPWDNHRKRCTHTMWVVFSWLMGQISNPKFKISALPEIGVAMLKLGFQK